MPEIPKAYNPEEVEDKIYKIWEESGYFNPDNLDLSENAETFSIAMPPPNVTGILHLGHALENALMDTMIRYQRMQGKKALLIPGTDHAAVATQAKVESDLVKSGKYKNPRQELGREKLLEIIRDYAERSKETILGQIRKMGTSCDWSRLAYTFDSARSRAVNEVFARMYRDGLIYRGYRVVNWSVKGQSTCSDEELVYIERPAKLYTFKYSKDFPIPIATTRPETKLGDTAVAINPKDKRYKKYIGKTFTVDVGASKPLEIKIIGEEGIDMNFGTGALGVTPAHSMIDYEMAEKNKLPVIKVIGEDGKMTAEAGKDYNGLTVPEAREKFIEYLKKEGLLEKEEAILQNVGTSDRFGDIVEVLPMTQWFVDVNKKIPGRKKSLKDLMREAVTVGHNKDAKQKVKITPDRFKKIYLNWIDNLRDWCISRQIWWGHRIPVWYKDKSQINPKSETKNPPISPFAKGGLKGISEKEIYVGIEPPKGEGWVQDPDTLDTWFSSGLWTFSILGWPEQTENLKTFHPTSWMQMGSELVFFWMARMILMSTYAIGQIPFRDVYIHGILRDKDGRKFSKSLGNGINPLEISKKYGTDALRLSLILGTTPGNDMRFYEEKVEGYRNFVNKLWNISRYIIEKSGGSKPAEETKINPKDCSVADLWILRKMMNLINDADSDLANYNFSGAGEKLRDFAWNDFADWYLEASKIENNKQKEIILNIILRDLLKLCHPFIPFVTEAIWQKIGGRGFLMVEKWPVRDTYEKAIKAADKTYSFQPVIDIVKAIRNLRAENKIEPALKIKVIFIAKDKDVKDLIKSQKEIIKGLARLSDFAVEIKKRKITKAVSAFVGGVEIYLPPEGAIDISKEIERIAKETAENEKIFRELSGRLANKDFLTKAKKEIVEEAKEKLKASKEALEKLKERKKILS